MKRLMFVRNLFILSFLVWGVTNFSISCSDTSSSDDPTPTPTSQATPPPGNQVGDSAIDFTLNDRNEQAHTLSQYKGKVILLNLSAMW